MRQNPGVQHVWIGKDHIGSGAHGLARILRRIAVVGERANLGTHLFHDGVEFVELVFGECLRGEEVESAGAGIA